MSTLLQPGLTISGSVGTLSEPDFNPQVMPAIDRTLNTYVALRVLDIFQNRGFFNDTNPVRIEEFRNSWVLPSEPLFQALLDILIRHDYITVSAENSYTVTAHGRSQRLIQDEIRETKGQLLTNDASVWAYITPTLRLINASLDSMDELLMDTKSGHEVLFPDGDRSLMLEFYTGNVQLYLNQLVATEVRKRLEQKLASGISPVRILEVGAGTGGTTTFVAKELAAYGTQIEYLYTDLGGGFVRSGRRAFGSDYPFMTFQTLNISAEPDTQGIESQSIDIVLGTNVFHATPSIQQSLTHTAHYLKNQGSIVINDLQKKLDFNTVIFGLMAEWWNAEDPAERLPHSPLLNTEGWTALLHTAGITVEKTLGVPGLAIEDSQQAIFVGQLVRHSS